MVGHSHVGEASAHPGRYGASIYIADSRSGHHVCASTARSDAIRVAQHTLSLDFFARNAAHSVLVHIARGSIAYARINLMFSADRRLPGPDDRFQSNDGCFALGFNGC